MQLYTLRVNHGMFGYIYFKNRDTVFRVEKHVLLCKTMNGLLCKKNKCAENATRGKDAEAQFDYTTSSEAAWQESYQTIEDPSEDPL